MTKKIDRLSINKGQLALLINAQEHQPCYHTEPMFANAAEQRAVAQCVQKGFVQITATGLLTITDLGSAWLRVHRLTERLETERA